ncbi:MAG: WYL domain-containing protein [Phycicoccus sp.]|nr:WYL domain-containing protein [Phycicoccus sp.]
MTENATERLSRLLTMVPWLVNRQGIDVAEAARGLGVTATQLESDLQLLFLCGYGSMPDELIDAQWESGQVFVSNAEAIARPLRLGVDEAVTLIVGLRTLRDAAPPQTRDAVERALIKLEAASGAAGEVANRVAVTVDEADARLALAEQAVREHRRLHVTYLVPGRDETTERDVDPMRVVGLDGRWYLEGWCHRAQDTRLFRIDRIVELTMLAEDGTPPPQAQQRDLDAGTFLPGPADQRITLTLDRSAAWVADYYPVESAQPGPDGAQMVTLRTADTEWIVRLVLRLGGAARVVDPAGLDEVVQERAQSALTAYGPD